MTRENKLALVVGFALILFVGILISDHFSVARNQASANLTSPQIADPLGTARSRNDPDLISLKTPPPAPPATAAAGLQPGEPAVSPSQMQAANMPSEPMSPEQRSNIDREVSLTQAGSKADQLSSPGARIPQHVEPVNASGADTAASGIATLHTRETEPIRIAGFETVQSEATINIKDMRFHDVREGESMFSICRQEYGDPSLVKALAKFNKMDDAASMRTGRKLLIPPAETLGGKSRTPPATPPATSASPTAIAANMPKTDASKAPAKPAAPASPKTYTVKAGDSLSLIAQRFLGDKERWRDLQRLNRELLADPDDLKVGMIIRLS